jgi:hypothetical protein
LTDRQTRPLFEKACFKTGFFYGFRQYFILLLKKLWQK